MKEIPGQGGFFLADSTYGPSFGDSRKKERARKPMKNCLIGRLREAQRWWRED
jgi:hypothetical protein